MVDEIISNINVTSNFSREGVDYLYVGCYPTYDSAVNVSLACYQLDQPNVSNTTRCAQFCDGFPSVIPFIFLGVSILSFFSCLFVFVSYFIFPKLRHSGLSTKVFLWRTLMDCVIAVGHIFSGGFRLAEAQTPQLLHACYALGSINQVALFASNLWFLVLSFDLIQAIRNPFSARPMDGVTTHLTIWSLSLITGVVLAALSVSSVNSGPGPSMFFWCWISIESPTIDSNITLREFAIASATLYYLVVFVSWLIALITTVTGFHILKKRLATSSETRRLVLRQNLLYVFFLGCQSFAVITMWIVQLIVTSSKQPHATSSRPYFFTNFDFSFAIIFAFFHSLRGFVDMVAWTFALSIGWKDFKDLYCRIRERKNKDWCTLNRNALVTPLLASKSSDSAINKALRRNAMYCINVGILDAVQLHIQYQGKIKRVGSVRDHFVAGQMMKLDEENQQQEREELYRNNPNHKEKSIRRLEFPATATIQSFAFIDLEPSIFSLLRNTFGITPKKYRESFRIRNAADIDREGMLEKFTEGKSGSFFYFTRDYRYIIKTVTSAEESFLQKIAYRYFYYMQNNKNTLITRFYGLHKVRLAKEQRFITVVVMDNIFHNKEQLSMHERYDLKGSWVGRRAVKGSREKKAYKGTLKDLDLGDKKICVGEEHKQLLMEQLREDTQFLESCGIMDYSLLLGIHNHEEFGIRSVTRPSDQSAAPGEEFVDVSIKGTFEVPAESPVRGGIEPAPRASPGPRGRARKYALDETETTLSVTTTQSQFNRGEQGVPWFREDYGGLRSCSPLHPKCTERTQSTCGDDSIPVATYYFGIIDILQEYNVRKKVEHMWKTKVQCQDKHGLSAIHPKEYGERFANFMESTFQ